MTLIKTHSNQDFWKQDRASSGRKSYKSKINDFSSTDKGSGSPLEKTKRKQSRKRVRFSKTNDYNIFESVLNNDDIVKLWYQKQDYKRFKMNNINTIVEYMKTKIYGDTLDPKQHCLVGLNLSEHLKNLRLQSSKTMLMTSISDRRLISQRKTRCE